VRSILTKAVAAFKAKGADHERLMSDDGWDYDDALRVRIKPTEKGIN
jgi:hypothetical protein